MTITATRYNASTGSVIAAITAPVLSCRCEYALFGGCVRASLEFEAAWGDAAVADAGDEIRIESDGEQIFAGRAKECRPDVSRSFQSVEVTGWWKLLDEVAVVVPASSDRLVFGTADDSDQPTVKTAFAAASWLFTNRVATSDAVPITESALTSPTYPCKFGNGGFAVNANDGVSKVLEDLATMDDCVVGIGADRKLYYIPRATVEALDSFQVRVAEDISRNWRTSGKGWALSGSFVYERRGPNTIAVASRDVNKTPGYRTYNVAGYLTGSRRGDVYSARGVRTGMAARRLARGLFRRFESPTLRVESVECLIGNRRFEPHLGQVAVYSESALVAEGLCGSISVNFGGPSIRASVTLGESGVRTGSGNPLNDPLARVGPSDISQIDTGDTAEIDFDDGFDGDGDDLHENADRDDYTDPPGVGVDALDYGPDTADETNGATSGSSVSLRQGKVTAVNAGSPTTYDVQEYAADGITETTLHEDLKPWETITFEVNDKCWIIPVATDVYRISKRTDSTDDAAGDPYPVVSTTAAILSTGS